eukprot:6193547-Pleurochrysis_carterae.AAC.1
MSQTYHYRHSPNQSLMAHTESATGSDHGLDAPIVCNVFSNLHDHVGQIKGPEVRKQVVPGLSSDESSCPRSVLFGCIRYTQVCSELVCHQHCCAMCCCPTKMPARP